MGYSWKRASLFRQMLAMVYDLLILMALWLVVASAFVAFNQGEALQGVWVRYGLMFPSLVMVTWLFYSGFWSRGGQTLGMRAWKIRVVRSDSRPMTVAYGLFRCACGSLSWALVGTGYLLALIGSNGDTLHDKLSKTCVVSTNADGKPL